MKIVNTLKFSAKNVNPMGVALGMVYVGAGAALLKIGAQSLIYGSGFRGSLTVFK